MPIRFISRTTSRPNGESPPSTGSSVAESAHGDVVVVGEGQVAHPERVQHPQRAERGVDRCARPRRPSARRSAPRRRPRSTSSAVRREGQVGRRTGRSSVHRVDLLQGGGDGGVARQRARAPRPTRTGRPTPPARSRGRSVCVGRRGCDDVEPVEVVAGLLARLPGQVVVPVDDRVLGEQLADPGGGSRGRRTLRSSAARATRVGHACGPTPRRPRQRRPGHPRVHPQRGRLRGAGRAARRRGLAARRRRRRRRRRGGQHLRLRRAGQEGLHRHPPRGGRPQGDRAHPGRRRRRLPRRALRPDRSPTQLPDADAVLGFDSYRDMSSHLTAILGRARPTSHVPVRPAQAAAAVARRSTALRQAGAASASARSTGRSADGGPVRAPRGCDARPVGAAEDRQRLRPALLVLRHPDVPRAVRLAPADRRLAEARWLGEQGVQRALPRQRELHVVRQGPRRPRAAREAAARAGRGRGHRAGAGVLPAAGRDPARPARRDGPTPGVVPYFDLSFQHASPTVLRRMRRFGGTEPFLDLIDRVRAREPAGRHAQSTSSSASPARPRHDVAELERFLVARPPRRGRRLRLLRRGRHRGREPRRQAARRRHRRAGRAVRPRSSRSSPRSGPRSASARAGRGARRGASTTRTATIASPAGPSTRGPTSTASPVRAGADGRDAGRRAPSWRPSSSTPSRARPRRGAR